MNRLKLLIVEDNEADLNSCKDCISDFQKEKECCIELIECKSIDEAFKVLDMTYDGAIIDIKLDTQGDEGNKILDKIRETQLRIPIAVLTATPGNVDKKPNYIGVYKKGEAGSGYADLLNEFWEIYNTGLTRIMGGRGKFEDSLGRIFNENLMLEKYRKKWIEYGNKDAKRTEKALLRHILSYLFQLLEEDDDSCFPEEFYLVSPVVPVIKTGSIVIKKESRQKFVVMTPACDLIIRTDSAGNRKRDTDRFLIVEIDSQSDVLPDYESANFSKDKEEKWKNTFRNKKSFYHWLPQTSFFDGGFVNFRKLSDIEIDVFNEKFGKPVAQISPLFVKDMVARFSAYYARQGQPEIDFSSILVSFQLSHNEN
jgi:CheY-like chemotaxis protein